MNDDVSARLLQTVYRALDDDADWGEILAQLVACFDAASGSVGVIEVSGGQRKTYDALANTGTERRSPPPDSLYAMLSADDEARSADQTSTCVETRHRSSEEMYEIHLGGRLREGAMVLLQLRRPERFQRAECQRLRQLTEHLARVARTRRELRRIRSIEHESATALSVLDVPAALVDRTCTVLATNRRFEQTLEQGALELDMDSRITTRRSQWARRLRDKVREIVDGAWEQPADEVTSELYVVLDARAHHQTLIVGNPVRPTDEAEARVLLSVYHRDAGHHIDDELLERLYSFTPTEAQTAARLAEGYTIDEIADFRGCAQSTVRTHLKRVLKKTDTHRQVALVRVILSSPAAKLATWGA